MSWGLAKRMLVLGAALLLLCVRTEAADRQIRPFAGATFGGTTPFVDFEDAASKLHPAIGVDAVFLGEMFGVDIDVADVPGFMEADNQLVVHSRVTTLCGNVVIAAPRRLAEYSLRPYVGAGGGRMRARRITSFNVVDVASVTPAFDVGVGAVAFVTNKTGVAWDVRRFQSFSDSSERTAGADDHLSFWRATMAVVFRY